MTKEELLRRLQAGERDFRGADLRGVDLRGVFLGAIDLREADLDGARTGVPLPALLLRNGGMLIMGLLVVAALTVNGGTGLAILFSSSFAQSASYVPGILAVLAMLSITICLVFGRVGYTIPAAILGGLVVALAIAVTGPAEGGFTATQVSPFAAGGQLVLSSHGSGVSIFGADVLVVLAACIGGALAFAIGGGGVAVVSIVVTALIMSAAKHITLSLTVGCLTICQVTAALALRHSAMRGDLRLQWVRNLIVRIDSLGGTRFVGTDLTEASFVGARLRGASFCGARLYHTRFRGAHDLHWAEFDPGALRLWPVQLLLSSGEAIDEVFSSLSLRGTYLHGAKLRGATLRYADLQEANLRGADLAEADLFEADLRGADLGQSMLEGATLAGARVDALTYERSGWDPDRLEILVRQGVKVVAMEAFPRDAQNRLLGERDGLMLSFSAQLSTYDRYLIDGVIIGVLGRDPDCKVEEFYNLKHSAVVRLTASRRRDLELVAEAVHQQIWELHQETALVRVQETFQGQNIRDGLSELMGRRLEKMELRESATVAEKRAQPRWTWVHPTRPDGDHLLGLPARSVFILSAPSDHEMARKLVLHLQPLRSAVFSLTIFGPDSLTPGDTIEEALTVNLDNADVVLVLVSSQIFQDGPWQNLVPRALARRGVGKKVIPVLLRPVSWEYTALADLQPLPDNGLPVTTWEDPDKAWTAVVTGVRLTLLSMA